MPRKPAFGHRADPSTILGPGWVCAICGQKLTVLRTTTGPQWRHQRRKTG